MNWGEAGHGENSPANPTQVHVVLFFIVAIKRVFTFLSWVITQLSFCIHLYSNNLYKLLGGLGAVAVRVLASKL